MTHTHLKELIIEFKKMSGGLLKEARRRESRSVDVSGGLKKKLRESAQELTIHRDRCMICERLTKTLKRYAFTILYLWEKDEEFQKAVQSSKGFCLSHLVLINELAMEVLNQRKLARWIQVVFPLVEENLRRLEGELHRFTQKFDYQSDGIPWESARDALPRSLQKLTGKVPESE
jgi:hypothetical protein